MLTNNTKYINEILEITQNNQNVFKKTISNNYYKITKWNESQANFNVIIILI